MSLVDEVTPPIPEQVKIARAKMHDSKAKHVSGLAAVFHFGLLLGLVIGLLIGVGLGYWWCASAAQHLNDLKREHPALFSRNTNHVIQTIHAQIKTQSNSTTHA